MLNAPILLTAALAACLWPTDQSGEGATPGLSMDPQAPPVDTTLVPSADAWTWHPHPNDNFGTTTDLRTGVGGYGRAFLRWDPQAIQDAVGSMTLIAARVEVTVQTSTGWSGSGGQVGLYRMTTDWTELGATDNCAVDAAPGNGHKDCSGVTAWSLHDPGQAPWIVPATDSVFLTNGQTGTVTFDVTADVAAFLAGTANFGWALKPANDAAAADVRVGAREGATPAALVLTVATDSRPPVPDGWTPPDSADALLVAPPGQPDVLVLRDFIHIVFDDSTSGAGVQAFLAKYNAVVVGGYPLDKGYIIRIPDPGTYAALDSVLTAMGIEPGVAAAWRAVWSEPPYDLGRYPSDGPLGKRPAWLGQATDATRAFRAIRAPLAWGCETGSYEPASSPVSIGIIEDVVDGAHADLNPSTKNPYAVAPNNALESRSIESFGPYSPSHGTGVAGVIAAAGDNEFGTAGLIWKADLHLFLLARQLATGDTRRVRDRGTYLARVVLPTALNSPVRILHSSITAPSNPRLAARIATLLDSLVMVTSGPTGRLFVQAAGNDRVSYSDSVADTLTTGGYLMQQAVLRVRGTPAADRILMVGAADADGSAIWADDIPNRGATLWLDNTDILAPADSILALARPIDFIGGVALVDGSSFAAPMATGVAAQLVAFDPSLKAEEVKGYILAGASEQMLPTGTLIPAPEVVGSGGLHLLNAYEALARVARERPGTPVCGFPVYTRNGQLLFERTPGQPVPQDVGGAQGINRVTVAQGGRILAADTNGFWIQFNHRGESITALPGVYQRMFLERDTADLLSPPTVGDFRLKRASGGDTLINLKTAVAPTADEFLPTEIASSPAGDWLAVLSNQQAPAASELVHEWSLLPIGGAGGEISMHQAVVASGLTCGDCPIAVRDATMGWSQDGQRLALALPWGAYSASAPTVLRSVMRDVTFPGGQPTGYTVNVEPFDGLEIVWPRFTAEGELVVNERELASGTCRRAWRVPGQTLLISSSPTAAADCDRTEDPRRVFNAPPPAVTTEAAVTGPAARLRSRRQ